MIVSIYKYTPHVCYFTYKKLTHTLYSITSKMTKSPLDSAPIQNSKPAPHASRKSKNFLTLVQYQNPYSLEVEYYTPKFLYDRIRSLEAVIATCARCIQVESQMPIVKPSCLLRITRTQVPAYVATKTDGCQPQQESFSMPKSMPVIDKRTNHLMRLKEKLRTEKIFSYHSSPKLQDILTAAQDMSMCHWNVLRFVCIIDATIHDYIATRDKEYEHHYHEMNAMLIHQLRQLESRCKDDIENIFNKVKDWAEQKLSKIKADKEQADMSNKSLDDISGMSMLMAKLFTETLNDIKINYDIFFSFKKQGYSPIDIGLVRSVVD